MDAGITSAETTVDEERAGEGTFTVRLERPDGTWMFEASSEEYLLYSMIDAGIETPFICEQGWCLACAAKLVAGKVDDSAALTRYPEDAEAGFLLLCSARPLTDLVLRQDIHETRREMTQHRIGLNQLARAYPRAAAPVSDEGGANGLFTLNEWNVSQETAARLRRGLSVLVSTRASLRSKPN